MEKCEICGKEVKAKQQLKIHMRTHSKGKEKVHEEMGSKSENDEDDLFVDWIKIPISLVKDFSED